MVKIQTFHQAINVAANNPLVFLSKKEVDRSDVVCTVKSCNHVGEDSIAVVLTLDVLPSRLTSQRFE